MTLKYNPYDYMILLRNNRILFKYLEYCSVYLSDDKGWVILGESSEGPLEIYELVNGLIRISIPLTVPHFINVPILSEVILGLQSTIEGIVTIDKLEETEELFLIYSIHINPNEEGSLDQCLTKFKQEEKVILEGFSLLEKDFNKLTKELNTGSKIPGVPNFNGRAPDEENLDSLWNEMNTIDKLSYDEEEE